MWISVESIIFSYKIIAVFFCILYIWWIITECLYSKVKMLRVAIHSLLAILGMFITYNWIMP